MTTSPCKELRTRLSTFCEALRSVPRIPRTPFRLRSFNPGTPRDFRAWNSQQDHSQAYVAKASGLQSKSALPFLRSMLVHLAQCVARRKEQEFLRGLGSGALSYTLWAIRDLQGLDLPWAFVGHVWTQWMRAPSSSRGRKLGELMSGKLPGRLPHGLKPSVAFNVLLP